MEHFLHRLADEPFMTMVLPVAFLCSVFMYRRRVKRESRPDYQRPAKRQH